jgi:hypothetical protein
MEHLPRPLITSAELMTWLQVGPEWIKSHTADPTFPAIDIGPSGAPRRTLRYSVDAIAEHLGIPVPPWNPQQAYRREAVASAA